MSAYEQLPPYERWMARSNLKAIRTEGASVEEQAARLRAGGYPEIAAAVEELSRRDYHVQCNVGKARYVVNFHDGVKTHPDGSRFYDIRIAGSKRELSAIVTELRRAGYVPR